MINLSHGAVFMIGAYAALQLVLEACRFHSGPRLGAAFLVSGVVGLLIDVLVLKPLRRRNAPHLIPMIATIGIAIFFNQRVARRVRRGEPALPQRSAAR